jgi:hypothetical protein
LDEQFSILQKQTNQSHVLQWGDKSFLSDPVSEYLSNKNRNIRSFFSFKMPIKRLMRNQYDGEGNFDSRMNKIQLLSAVYAREKTL